MSPCVSPTTIDDPLTAILRSGARRLLAQAIEAEAEAFLAAMKGVQLPDGRDRAGAARARPGAPGADRDRPGRGAAGEAARPRRRRGGPSASGSPRRSCHAGRGGRRSLDALLPILYLRGVSMGDFQEALAALLGKDAPNLSPSVIARLRGDWQADYDALAAARSVGAALRLHLGRRRLPAGAAWSRRPSACWC